MLASLVRIGPIVTNATVIAGPTSPAVTNPRPPAVPQNGDDTDLTGITSG